MSLHPFHSSVGECIYNEKEHVWEISIRLFQDDFEVGMSAFTGSPFKLKDSEQVKDQIEQYTRQHIGVQVNQKLTTPYRFLGWEPVGDVVWIYLEIPSSQDLRGVYLENSLLSESFPDQTNLWQVARGTTKKSYLFQKSKWVQPLD